MLSASTIFRRTLRWQRPNLVQSPLRSHSTGQKDPNAPWRVTFITSEGEQITCRAKDGENLLDIAHANQVDLEGNLLCPQHPLCRRKNSSCCNDINIDCFTTSWRSFPCRCLWSFLGLFYMSRYCRSKMYLQHFSQLSMVTYRAL